MSCRTEGSALALPKKMQPRRAAGARLTYWAACTLLPVAPVIQIYLDLDYVSSSLPGSPPLSLQRFSQASVFKRTVLELIAEELLSDAQQGGRSEESVVPITK